MQVARPYLLWRLLAPAVYGALMVPIVGLAVAPAYWEAPSSREDLAGAYAAVVFFGAVFSAITVALWRAKLTWDDDGVGVRNLGGWRRWTWHDVADVEATYFGISIRLVGGWTALAIAVQKANAAIGVETRADRVVAAMLEKRDAALRRSRAKGTEVTRSRGVPPTGGDL
ncbi:hypothetical protein [Thalassiella azotivora]